MIAGLLSWLGARGISEEQLKALLLVVAVLASIAGVIIWFDQHDAGVIEQHEAKTQVQVERTGRAADSTMWQRIEQARIAEDAARKEFDNATANLPSEGLTRRQRIDVCLELRDAGTDTAVIPECADLHPRAQTGTLAQHPPRQ